jgi:hypothetical protein
VDFIWRKAELFRWICRKQSIITNSLQIRDWPILNTVMAFHCAMAMTCPWIWHKHRYFRFATEQGVAEALYHCGIALLTGNASHRNITGAFCYLKLSAENGSPDGQFAIACMAENGIGPFPFADLNTAVRSYERCCDLSRMGAACLGWCLQTGWGIPIDSLEEQNGSE